MFPQLIIMVSSRKLKLAEMDFKLHVLFVKQHLSGKPLLYGQMHNRICYNLRFLKFSISTGNF